MSSPAPDAELIRSLIAEVQRLGLSTASTVADRFAAMARGVGDADGRYSPSATSLTGLPGSAAVAEGWRSVLVGLAAMAAATPGRVQPPGQGVERIDLSQVAPGGTAKGRAHLHNTTADDIGGIGLLATDMIEAGGGAISAAAITLTPAVIELAAPGSSRPIEIAVVVAADQAPGIYHGLLAMSSPPGGVIAIRVTVLEPGTSP